MEWANFRDSPQAREKLYRRCAAAVEENEIMESFCNHE
jgi:hypothetical protein